MMQTGAGSSSPASRYPREIFRACPTATPAAHDGHRRLPDKTHTRGPPPLASSSRGGPIPLAKQHPKSRWLVELLPQVPGLRGQQGGSSTPRADPALGRGPSASHQLPCGAGRTDDSRGRRGVCRSGLRARLLPALARERRTAMPSCKEMSEQRETGPWRPVSR